MSHKVSIDPVDDSGIDVSHLEQRRDLWVPCSAIDPDHVCHPPGAFRVGDDHGHACFDVQENWIRLGRSNGACMVNQRTNGASTDVLAQVGGFVQPSSKAPRMFRSRFRAHST